MIQCVCVCVCVVFPYAQLKIFNSGWSVVPVSSVAWYEFGGEFLSVQRFGWSLLVFTEAGGEIKFHILGSHSAHPIYLFKTLQSPNIHSVPPSSQPLRCTSGMEKPSCNDAIYGNLMSSLSDCRFSYLLCLTPYKVQNRLFLKGIKIGAMMLCVC